MIGGREEFPDVILCNGKGKDGTNAGNEPFSRELALVAIQARREIKRWKSVSVTMYFTQKVHDLQRNANIQQCVLAFVFLKNLWRLI